VNSINLRRLEKNMEKLPWWAVVALAFLGIQYASQRQVSHLEAQDLPSPSRRLMESPAPPEEPTTTPIPFVPPEPPTPPPAWIAPRAAPKEFNLTWQTLPVKQGVLPNVSAIKLTVPCLTFIRFQLIEPCGNLTLPENGILFSTPFGQLQMPGPQSLFHSVKHVEKSLGIYTVCGVVIGIVCWLCFTCCIPDNRHKFFKKVEDIFSGSKIHDFGDDVEEDDEDGDHVEREKSARMDPMSPHFIAPGNIYRLLAVLHPGLIGFQAWFGYAFRGFICGYMQFYLPFNVITNVLTTWECVGIKSPLWFLANLTTFAAMATALGSLSSMFAGKCSKHVLHGAEANMYILSHYNPGHAVDAVDEDEESVESSFDSSLRSNAKSGVIPSRIATTLVRVTADTVEPATEKLREAYVSLERTYRRCGSDCGVFVFYLRLGGTCDGGRSKTSSPLPSCCGYIDRGKT